MSTNGFEYCNLFSTNFTGDIIIIHMTGDSLETLKWTVLDQQLNHARKYHKNLSISDSVCTDLIMKYKHRLPSNI